MAGVRAVLWHHGESEFGDANSGSIPDYKSRLTALIQKSRQDFGGRNLPWMVARASFDGTANRSDIITIQQQVIDSLGLNVFQGPYNDTITLRNAGTSDVHFRNAFRPSPHPRYYLNPNAIPIEMGLSRFARNWNNSLSNAFFENAQPITPIQFAATGTLADNIPSGSTVDVSFATLGTFASDNQWQVQLLDSLGHYKAVLGSGSLSTRRVKLPDAYQSGRFRVRVVAQSPGLAAVPSNLFRIATQPLTADLSLRMSISQRTPGESTPGVNDPVTITLVVRNDGASSVSTVSVRNRLPDNLAVVSTTGLSLSGNVLTGTISNLNVGIAAALSFVAQPTAAGTYHNAAEISQSSLTDPDSQPDSGTGDGQDDAASLDFRTRQTSAAVFTSPNPNQVPLPAVVGNQPTPDPAKADVSLSLSVNNRTPQLDNIIMYTLTLSNRGGLTATGLSVSATLPAGQTFVSGDDLSPSNGNLVGGVSSLSVDGSFALRFRARVTALGQGICTAQLTAASQPDPDSVPDNGVDNGEDDTTRTDVRGR